MRKHIAKLIPLKELRQEVLKDLEKLGYFKKSPKRLELKKSAQLVKQVESFDNGMKNCKKSVLKHFTEKLILLNAKSLLTIFSLLLYFLLSLRGHS